ncbi:MAG: hypothetical protein H6744_03875 [Deltaproteobacteria bacterium]|nr:hypothetical protein [Deltaproteobacteria bacterium]
MSLRIAADLGSLAGRVRLTVEVGDTALDHVDLWAFPERLASPPPAMDEVDEPRLFPAGFRPGGMQITEVLDAGGRALVIERLDTTRFRVALSSPVPPGGRAELDVAFTTTVPWRFGPFGHDAGELTLDGGFFPRPPPLESGHFRADLPPDLLRFDLRVTWEGEQHALAVVNGRVTRLPPSGGAVAVGEGAARRVALLLLTRHHVSTLDTPQGRVVFIHRSERRGRRAPGELFDFGFLDVQGQVLATVGAAMGFLAQQGIAPPATLLCVEAPLRRSIARAAPGMLLVSDRAFDLTPYEPLRRFHRLPLVRAAAAVSLESQVAQAAPPGRADQVSDMVAADLAERWEQLRYGGHEGARELLSKGSFVAEVDDALNAPQIPFESVYFRGPNDTDAFRDTLELFSHERPVGRFWREKLVDRVGANATAAVAQAVATGLPLEKALARHAHEVDLTWLASWDEGTPPRNYALAETTRGADAEGPYVDVRVRVEGPPLPAERVTVRVAGGSQGPAEASAIVGEPDATIRVRTDARRPRVQLDPRRRLEQSDMGRPVDPRADDLSHPRWRVLLDGVGVSLNSASSRVDTLITGFIRREADIDNSILLAAFDLERRTGVSVDWIRGLGPKVVPNRRRFGLGLGTSVAWLKPQGKLGSGLGLRLRVGFGDLTFRSRTDPRRGVARGLWLGPTMALRDGRADAGFSVSGFLGRLVPVGARHTLGGVLRADALFGEVSSSESLGIGGLGAVRAFATFARLGEMRITGSLEWRHRYTRDVAIDVGHLAWVQGIDGVFFVDAGLLGATPRGTFRQAALSLGVGYGLRFHYVVGGLSPMVFSLDAAVPILDGGRLARGVAPVTILAGVGQSF